MVGLLAAQTFETPTCESVSLAFHPPGKTPEVTRGLWSRKMRGLMPNSTRSGIRKDRCEWCERKRMRNIHLRSVASPNSGVFCSKFCLVRKALGVEAVEMFKQVFEGKKRVANGCLGPIDECTVVGVNEDIPRIEVKVVQCDWQSSISERRKRFPDLIFQYINLADRESARRIDDLLSHKLSHDGEKLIDATKQCLWPDIAETGI